jgi:hypothetical protein
MGAISGGVVRNRNMMVPRKVSTVHLVKVVMGIPLDESAI